MQQVQFGHKKNNEPVRSAATISVYRMCLFIDRGIDEWAVVITVRPDRGDIFDKNIRLCKKVPLPRGKTRTLPSRV